MIKFWKSEWTQGCLRVRILLTHVNLLMAGKYYVFNKHLLNEEKKERGTISTDLEVVRCMRNHNME